MSRIRCPHNCFHFKRRNATRSGYVNVDEEDSDVSMVGADDIGERNSITYLLDARLHISPVSTEVLVYIQVIHTYILKYIIFLYQQRQENRQTDDDVALRA